MRISTRGRYALRMLLDLAEHDDGGFTALKDIAQRQSISKKYLEQIVALLKPTDLLRTNRGYLGGYKLGRAPGQVTVGEILRLTEGGLVPVACLEDSPNRCERCETCQTLPVWQGLGQVIDRYLDGITLQAILDDKRASGADGYSI